MSASTNAAKLLNSMDLVLRGSHVVYTSGKHGRDYFKKDKFFPYTPLVESIGQDLAAEFILLNVGAVVGPDGGGRVLAHETASALARVNHQEVLVLSADKVDGPNKEFSFRDSYKALVKGKRILVVDDVLTTAGSLKGAISAVRSCEGRVIGASVVCNGGNISDTDLGVSKLSSILSLSRDIWDAEDCPLCKQGVPINTEVGHGAKFLAEKGRT